VTEYPKFLRGLGKNIDRIRKEQGLSFQELSLRCDIEKSNLVKLTNQGSNITVSTLYKIAKGLEVPVYELLKF
jgi:transcriptional regulator with XRE-family HTH domain